MQAPLVSFLDYLSYSCSSALVSYCFATATATTTTVSTDAATPTITTTTTTTIDPQTLSQGTADAAVVTEDGGWGVVEKFQGFKQKQQHLPAFY